MRAPVSSFHASARPAYRRGTAPASASGTVRTVSRPYALRLTAVELGSHLEPQLNQRSLGYPRQVEFLDTTPT
jgi:hypothetical protein